MTLKGKKERSSIRSGALGVLGGGGSRKEADDVEELERWMFNIKSKHSKNKVMSGVHNGSFGKKA